MNPGEIMIGNQELLTAPRVADKLESIIVMYTMTHGLKMTFQNQYRNIVFEIDEFNGFKYRLKIKHYNREIMSIIFVKMDPISSHKNRVSCGIEPTEMVETLDVLIKELNGENILNVK
jgi:hypothetical protein